MEKHKIIVPDNITIEELREEIDQGGKFVIYQYCISIFFAVTLQRLSPAIFIKKGQDTLALKRRYNTISAILGWWGIPWGPIYTTRSFKVNNRGGIDVTNDIMLNINSESLHKKEISIEKVSQIFVKPDKWDIKAFNKSIKKDFETDPNIKRVYVGLFINTSEDVEPYYVVGIESKIDFEKSSEQIRGSLSSQFRKHVFFDFLDLTTKSEIVECLEKQGIRIV